MTADSDHLLQPDDTPVPTRRSAWRQLLRSSEGRLGLVLTALMLGMIATGHWFAPYSPTESGVGLPAEVPSLSHLLGTDGLGRDVLSRLLTGGNLILMIAFAGVTLAYVLGGAIGAFAAYRGGVFDMAVIRTFDLFIALPSLLIFLVIIGALGNSTPVLILTLTFVYVSLAGRTVRGAAQAQVMSDYVAAAQARGERTSAILFREILPNMAAPVIADYGLRLAYGIVTIATLNFLGLGVQPPTPDWGMMVSESRNIITLQFMAVLAPMVAIASLAVGLNLIADSLSRHLTHESTRGIAQL